MDKIKDFNQSRTLGDGMERPEDERTQTFDFSKVLTNISKPNPSILNSMKRVEPKSKVFNLVPKYVPQDMKIHSSILTRPKEPKFIPYEPYKGAVQPIKPRKITKRPVVPQSASKNNIEIHELVTQMAEIRTTELNKAKLNALQENQIIPVEQWVKDKLNYENDIKNLKETISHLENQLKFQAQVNSELKTLLVAAVGEDLESRVQHLTEDKLSLARALLNSANHLTSHQEQTEWLSGQCEVWRSKFLASSLMVEELARWKSSLTKRTSNLQEILKRLLNEHSKIQMNMLETFNNLKAISLKTNPESDSMELKSQDILELSNRNLEMSTKLVNQMNISTDSLSLEMSDKLNEYTALEKLAVKILKNPVSINNSQDLLCTALMGVASSVAGEQKFLQVPNMHPCCAHCKGEVMDI